MKRLCAKAALDLVPDHGIIGLGGGETISYLAEDIKEARKDVKVVTPSDHTAQVCKKLGLEIVDTKEVKEIEIAFDGCDQVDSDIDAYKKWRRNSHIREDYAKDGKRICITGR